MLGQQLHYIKKNVYDSLSKLRPNIVSIVDGFGYTDRELNSVLGRRDGNVYENLLKWAQASPLNKHDVTFCGFFVVFRFFHSTTNILEK